MASQVNTVVYMAIDDSSSTNIGKHGLGATNCQAVPDFLRASANRTPGDFGMPASDLDIDISIKFARLLLKSA